MGRYLCSVAALNAAGEVGPPTPDVNSLPFPNPCAVCGPSPQALASFPEMQMVANSQAMMGAQMGYYSNEQSTEDPEMEQVLGTQMQEVWEPVANGRGLGRAQQQMLEQMDYQQDRPPLLPRSEDAMTGPYVPSYGASGYDRGRSAAAHTMAMREEEPDYDDPPVQRCAPAHAGAMREAPDIGAEGGRPPSMPSNFVPLPGQHQSAEQASGQVRLQEVGQKQESGWAANLREARQHLASGPAASFGGGLQDDDNAPRYNNLSTPSHLMQPRPAAAAVAGVRGNGVGKGMG